MRSAGPGGLRLPLHNTRLLHRTGMRGAGGEEEDVGTLIGFLMLRFLVGSMCPAVD
jgi:hypothetical protein